MHHTDLEIDKLHGQVQAAMEAFYAEPIYERLLFWERLASRLWGLEEARRKDRIEGGFGDPGQPVWRGPLDHRPAGFTERPRAYERRR